MDIQLNNEKAKSTLNQVMETFAFMFCDFNVDRSACPEGPLFKADITLQSNKYKGQLDLVIPAESAKEMATNALGLDFDEVCTMEEQLDVLRELMNQLGGKLISELAGEDVAFEIFIPHAEPAQPADWDAISADPATLPVLVEENSMLFRLAFESI